MKAVAGAKPAAVVHLLDGNVLFALVDEAHVHHAAALAWFAADGGGFATCPITQGTLLRLAMHVARRSAGEAVAVLRTLTAHPRHHFWPDALDYHQVRWQGVLGHRQVTDAYLAALARHHGGRLASFDKGLVVLHPDVGVALDAG
jgi:hypothetical protein